MTLCQVIARGPRLSAAAGILGDSVSGTPCPSTPLATLFQNCLLASLPHETVSSLTAEPHLFISVYSCKLLQILSGARQILKIQMRCTYIFN